MLRCLTCFNLTFNAQCKSESFPSLHLIKPPAFYPQASCLLNTSVYFFFFCTSKIKNICCPRGCKITKCVIKSVLLQWCSWIRAVMQVQGGSSRQRPDTSTLRAAPPTALLPYTFPSQMEGFPHISSQTFLRNPLLNLLQSGNTVER